MIKVGSGVVATSSHVSVQTTAINAKPLSKYFICKGGALFPYSPLVEWMSRKKEANLQ